MKQINKETYMAKFIFNIEEDDLMELKIAAKEEDLTVSQVLRKLVRGYLLAREIAKKKERDGK